MNRPQSKVNRSTHPRKTPVRQQYAYGYPQPGAIVRKPLVDRKHALGTDHNLQQDNIKRKSTRELPETSTPYRESFTRCSQYGKDFAKQSDKNKGMAELIRHISMSFTQLMRFFKPKMKKNKILTKR